MQFGAPGAAVPVIGPAAEPPKAKPAREKTRCDPKLVAAARECRDRWLENLNAGRFLPPANGKYDVARAIAHQAPAAAKLLAA